MCEEMFVKSLKHKRITHLWGFEILVWRKAKIILKDFEKDFENDFDFDFVYPVQLWALQHWWEEHTGFVDHLKMCL